MNNTDTRSAFTAHAPFTGRTVLSALPPASPPEWRRRALEAAARSGRLVAVRDTSGTVAL